MWKKGGDEKFVHSVSVYHGAQLLLLEDGIGGGQWLKKVISALEF